MRVANTITVEPSPIGGIDYSVLEQDSHCSPSSHSLYIANFQVSITTTITNTIPGNGLPIKLTILISQDRKYYWSRARLQVGTMRARLLQLKTLWRGYLRMDLARLHLIYPYELFPQNK